MSSRQARPAPAESVCCCAPEASVAAAAPARAAYPAPSGATVPERFVELPGSRALIGTNRPVLPQDGEGPLRRVRVGRIAIDPFAVTNTWFAAFAAATGYATDAERIGWSFVFHSFVPAESGPTRAVAAAPWWRAVNGADWRHPDGPESTIEGREDHPVVQVSLNDARAFAHWAGGRLPSEAEWEHAARGGLGDVTYPWGDTPPDDESFMPCNIWQGAFPSRNSAADGWTGTCPVDAFSPNGYGLYNLCGNVWEWCDEPMRIRSLKRDLRAADRALVRDGMVLTKGGSYLCHASYCHRYRIAARSGNTADSATGHIGFRIVVDIGAGKPGT